MQYRELNVAEIDRQLFRHFDRYQEVTKCWRKKDGRWMIADVSFIDQWNEQDYNKLIAYLKNTIEASGVVFGAFMDGMLKGFASVDGNFFDSNKEYLDLTCIHVSSDARGRGVGKRLFHMAVEWAKAKGATKLYISAHSSVESQAFYRAMGCVEAVEYDAAHVEKEPCDCQMDCDLSLIN